MITLNSRAPNLPARRIAEAKPLVTGPQPISVSMVAYALAYTASVVEKLLIALDAEIPRTAPDSVTITRIQEAVAEVAGTDLAEMRSARRARSVARPRQVAMTLAKEMTSHSLPVIGRAFGGRDHTTVMHAVKKIAELRAGGDSKTINLYEEAKRRLQG